MMVLCILCTVNTWLGLEVYNQHKDHHPTTIYRHLVHAGLQVDFMFVKGKKAKTNLAQYRWLSFRF